MAATKCDIDVALKGIKATIYYRAGNEQQADDDRRDVHPAAGTNPITRIVHIPREWQEHSSLNNKWNESKATQPNENQQRPRETGIPPGTQIASLFDA